MHITAIILVLMSGCVANGAQPEPIPAPAAATELDQVLDMLHARGQNLKSLSAKVKLMEQDPSIGDSTTRTGVFVLQISDEDTRARIYFDRAVNDEGKARVEKREYVLGGGKLLDRHYEKTLEVTRVIHKPGEKINLFSLGGPFPLPIGQKREEVYRDFTATREPPASDDPAGTVHVKLIPHTGTALSKDFKSLDIWVSTSLQMPVRIDTLDVRETQFHRTELTEMKVNEKLDAGELQPAKIDNSKWTKMEGN